MSKKATKRLMKNQSTEEDEPIIINLDIKYGKFVRQISYNTVKLLGTLTMVFLIGITIFSLKLFSSAVIIRNRLGYFINMVSSGDGEILPSLQALPVLVFMIIDFALMYFAYKIFDAEECPQTNRSLFLLIIVGVILIFIIIVLLFAVIVHIYGEHAELHNGIIEAMKNYSSKSLYKKQIDRLQIEFQCCGSKKYEEWYNITWYDDSLAKSGSTDNAQGNTPFSCCSIAYIFPCIHHNIESTGKVYLYNPEVNLSISTSGCYSRIREKKQDVGWGIVGNLFLYIMLQGALLICLRFLQTAHFESSKFVGHSRGYTIWLFGYYVGRKKPEAMPPNPPPIPPELME